MNLHKQSKPRRQRLQLQFRSREMAEEKRGEGKRNLLSQDLIQLDQNKSLKRKLPKKSNQFG